MNNSLIREVGEALYGPRYRTDFAEALDVNERTMRRWVDDMIDAPPGVMFDCLRLVTERAATLDDLIERLKIAAAP